ncbi:MAG: helix-turn-helix domain-containing protein [Planctomycetaceae bacterium]|nr:helix-turn-helix domain-containing protein [Planctomycetaceae bacterium]
MLAKKLHKDNSISIDDICKTLHISRSTLYRYLKMKKVEQIPENGT